MADLNSLSVVGRLTRDAELKTGANGTSFVTFSIANNTGFGQYEKTNFFKCVYFGKGAAGIAQHLVKGKQVALVGPLETNTWTSNGEEHKDWQLNVRDCSLIGSKKDEPVERQGEEDYNF